MDTSINVLGTPLALCSHEPVTGWYRDGCCNTDASDRGSHTVCALVTDDFLACLAEMGNDLRTGAPEHDFPGLREGDCWCVCASSWYAAYRQGRACPVYLESTHQRALRAVPLEALLEHAVAPVEA
jgi:uncharacterized protein (DUF2237 family)